MIPVTYTYYDEAKASRILIVVQNLPSSEPKSAYNTYFYKVALD